MSCWALLSRHAWHSARDEHRRIIGRNALYKLLYDARLRLKHHLECEGVPPKELIVRKSDLMPTNNKTMKSIFDQLRRRFKKWYQPDPMMQELLQSLAMTEAHEISCDEVFAVLDQFVDAVARGENVLIFMPLIRQHLDTCPDCREEYETLLEMLQPAVY